MQKYIILAAASVEYMNSKNSKGRGEDKNYHIPRLIYKNKMAFKFLATYVRLQKNVELNRYSSFRNLKLEAKTKNKLIIVY